LVPKAEAGPAETIPEAAPTAAPTSGRCRSEIRGDIYTQRGLVLRRNQWMKGMKRCQCRLLREGGNHVPKSRRHSQVNSLAEKAKLNSLAGGPYAGERSLMVLDRTVWLVPCPGLDPKRPLSDRGLIRGLWLRIIEEDRPLTDRVQSRPDANSQAPSPSHLLAIGTGDGCYEPPPNISHTARRDLRNRRDDLDANAIVPGRSC
jgi:hypothetical protein